MKRPFHVSFILIIFVGLVVLLFADTLIVKIQSTHVRKEPKFYAASLAALRAGDNVEKISAQDGWLQVKTAGGVVGWVHASALEPKKFSLLAMDKSLKTQASASEVALAGKGFNKQVEESYRTKHSDVSFVWVDKMLQVKIPPSQVEEFLKKGKLGEFRGGQ